MMPVKAEDIRDFIIEKYKVAVSANVPPASIADQFDLLSEGIVDSMGILELLSSIEDRFNIEVDLEELDTDLLTQIGPLSRYMAEHAKTRT